MLDKRLWQYARSHGLSLFCTIFTGLLSGAVILFQAYLLANIVDKVVFGGEGAKALLPSFAVLFAVILVRALLAYAEERFALVLSQKVQNDLNKAILEKYSRLGVVGLGRQNTGELINLATEGMNALDIYFRSYLPQLFKAASIPVFFLFWVFPLDFVSGIIMLITAPLVPLFMMLIGKWTKSVTARSWTILARISGYLQDVLQGLLTLKQLGQAERQQTKIAEISDDFAAVNMKVLRIAFLSALSLELLTTLSIALVAVGLGVRLVEGMIDFPAALFLILLAPEFYLPLRSLGVQFHGSLNGMEAAKAIFSFLALPEENLGKKQGDKKENEKITLSAAPFIELKNISYSYEDGRDALVDLSIRAGSGEIIALVGASGGGKSTVLKILAGLISEQEGEFLINCNNLATDMRFAWRSNVAFVSQKPHIFAATVFDNIKLGSNAENPDIISACKELGADEFISALPDGYNTMLGDGGHPLSGGESQLIALARAYVKKAPVLLCDEATQSLDLLSEKRVVAAMERVRQGKTVIISAHRLQTIKNADKIYLLADGRVQESGSFFQLSASSGAFSRLLEGKGVEEDE